LGTSPCSDVRGSANETPEFSASHKRSYYGWVGDERLLQSVELEEKEKMTTEAHT
jgi:hypothetical protein